jgi:predicted deacylase
MKVGSPKRPPKPGGGRVPLVRSTLIVALSLSAMLAIVAVAASLATLGWWPAGTGDEAGLAVAPSTPKPIPPRPAPGRTFTRIFLGKSVGGEPIYALHTGDGPHRFVLVGCIHGDEIGSTTFIRKLMSHVENDPAWLPADASLYVIPTLNPDGYPAQRTNANDVDLNRNWATHDWQMDVWTPEERLEGGGGEYPFSEPETRALRTLLSGLAAESPGDVFVVYYHSAYPGGAVFPGDYDQESLEGRGVIAARAYAEGAGFAYREEWEAYPATGTALDWAAQNGIIAIDVELPTSDEPYVTANLAGLRALFAVADELHQVGANYPVEAGR